jgi:hypothetical protein
MLAVIQRQHTSDMISKSRCQDFPLESNPSLSENKTFGSQALQRWPKLSGAYICSLPVWTCNTLTEWQNKSLVRLTRIKCTRGLVSKGHVLKRCQFGVYPSQVHIGSRRTSVTVSHRSQEFRWCVYLLSQILLTWKFIRYINEICGIATYPVKIVTECPFDCKWNKW